MLVAPWRYSERWPPSHPRQGWKLHVSATVLSAGDVFARALPVLRRHAALYKVPDDLALLAWMNSGNAGYSQIGKFITAYPRDAAHAVMLARDLHRATNGLAGPQVPFDRRYRRSSLVFYRYGSFVPGLKGTSAGIRDPAGGLHPDLRRPGSAVPAWLEDPFNPKPPKTPPPSGPIGLDYLVVRALAQRGKGAVFEAIDIAHSPARPVVIKQGRRHGDTDWLGDDGYSRVKREGRTLRKLRTAGLPVPRVFRRFIHRGDAYLVLEKINGRPLLPATRAHPARPSWRGAARILDRMLPLVARLHRAGWVWRDCKPPHIFLLQGVTSLIDFEGACRVDDTRVLPWGSPEYLPPSYRKPFVRRQRSTAEDDYALGVIAFQFLAGEFPPVSARARSRMYTRAACPGCLRRRIENLLRAGG